MADTPEQARYGRVVWRAVSFRADSPDTGDRPDEVPLNGQVILTPSVGTMRWPTADPPRTAVIETLTCPLINGWLYPPGTTTPDAEAEAGVYLISSQQPEAEPDLVQWVASFRLNNGGAAQPGKVVFEVPADATIDLSTIVPSPPAPGTVVIVSSEERIRAEEAADRAEEAAMTAVEPIAADAAAARAAAEAAQAEAAASATAAAEAAANATAPTSEAVAAALADDTSAAHTAVAGMVTTALAPVIPRTGVRAVGQNELVFNVMDYGAVPDGATDNTAAFRAAIDAAASHTPTGLPRVVYVPWHGNNYRFDGQVNIPAAIVIRGGGSSLSSPTLWFNQGPDSELYGLAAIDGPALGASPQEGFLIEGIRFRGGAKALIRAQGVAVFRIRDCYFHTTTSTALSFDYCQDFKVDDVDMYKCGVPDNYATDLNKSLVVATNCNNAYFDMLRIEAPEGVAIYHQNSGGEYFRGKIDCNVQDSPDPNIVLDQGSIWMQNFGLRGGDYRAAVGGQGARVLLKGRSTATIIDSDLSGTAESFFKFVDPIAVHNPTNYAPGVYRRPGLTLRNVGMAAQASNDSTARARAAVDYLPPSPDLDVVGAFTLPAPYYRITARDLNGGRVRAYIQYTTDNGATWTDIAPGDNLIGAWLTDMETGDRARIVIHNSGSRHTLEATEGFPGSSGNRYRIDHGPGDGVNVELNGSIQYRTIQDPDIFAEAHFKTYATPSAAATYNATTFRTTIPLTADVTTAAQAGHYLYDPVTKTYRMIRTLAADRLTVDHDVAAKIVVGRQYQIRGGAPSGTLAWQPRR